MRANSTDPRRSTARLQSRYDVWLTAWLCSTAFFLSCTIIQMENNPVEFHSMFLHNLRRIHLHYTNTQYSSVNFVKAWRSERPNVLLCESHSRIACITVKCMLFLLAMTVFCCYSKHDSIDWCMTVRTKLWKTLFPSTKFLLLSHLHRSR